MSLLHACSQKSGETVKSGQHYTTTFERHILVTKTGMLVCKNTQPMWLLNMIWPLLVPDTHKSVFGRESHIDEIVAILNLKFSTILFISITSNPVISIPQAVNEKRKHFLIGHPFISAFLKTDIQLKIVLKQHLTRPTRIQLTFAALSTPEFKLNWLHARIQKALTAHYRRSQLNFIRCALNALYELGLNDTTMVKLLLQASWIYCC